MDEHRAFGALGLCMRAGKCKSGALACENTIKAGRAKLLMVDSQMSEASRAHWRELCKKYDVAMLEAANIGQAIGKQAHLSVVITDSSFSTMITGAYSQGK